MFLLALTCSLHAPGTWLLKTHGTRKTIWVPCVMTPQRDNSFCKAKYRGFFVCFFGRYRLCFFILLIWVFCWSRFISRRVFPFEAVKRRVLLYLISAYTPLLRCSLQHTTNYFSVKWPTASKVAGFEHSVPMFFSSMLYFSMKKNIWFCTGR